MTANVETIPDLIVQNRSIALRSAPFHRQRVFSGRRDKCHSTHSIRSYGMHYMNLGTLLIVATVMHYRLVINVEYLVCIATQCVVHD